jgi:predicted Fe-Mo cluster-binding NifX family protein
MEQNLCAGVEVTIMHVQRIAVAQDGGGMVSDHFGHCEGYGLYMVEESRIVDQRFLKNPGHEPGRLPALLASHQVNCVLAGGIGPRAVDLFCRNGIEVILGVRGKVDDVVRDYLAGKLTPGESACHHACGTSHVPEEPASGREEPG